MEIIEYPNKKPIFISGFLRESLNEWPKKISSVIFTNGCNWRCSYCHSSSLFNSKEEIDKEEILNYLRDRKDWIDGVVITGGEPTNHGGLILLLDDLKKEGFDVLLRTNGSNPIILEYCFEFLHSVSIDLKQDPFSDIFMDLAMSTIYDSKSVMRSLNLVLNSDLEEKQIRTTLCPAYINKDNIKDIGSILGGMGTWYLQQYSSENVYNINKCGKKEYNKEELNEIYEEAKKIHPDVILVE